MNIYTVLITGCLAVLLLDALGSIASCHFNFNYGLLSPFSMLIFGMVAAYANPVSNFHIAISMAALVGLFDATIGWKTSKMLHANMGILAQEDSDHLEWDSILFTIFFAVLCGIVGAYFWG